jgi:RNA polymerase-interacting CarD/CdnL/TRCF family regulator
MDALTLSRLWKKAIERGWEPRKDMPLYLRHVTDASKLGRPLLSQEICDEVLKVVTKNNTTRIYSCLWIAKEVSKNLGKEDIISASTVYHILKKNRYGNYKPTIKPGLT